MLDGYGEKDGGLALVNHPRRIPLSSGPFPIEVSRLKTLCVLTADAESVPRGNDCRDDESSGLRGWIVARISRTYHAACILT